MDGPREIRHRAGRQGKSDRARPRSLREGVGGAEFCKLTRPHGAVLLVLRDVFGTDALRLRHDVKVYCR